jgi:predicted ATPase
MTYLFVGVLVLTGPLAHGADGVAGLTTEADLDAALAKALDGEDASRAAITSLLQRDDVRSMARGFGLDVQSAESAVRTLQGDELQRLSLLASDASGQLAGGDRTISISLVAALLIVIIIILVAD